MLYCAAPCSSNSRLVRIKHYLITTPDASRRFLCLQAQKKTKETFLLAELHKTLLFKKVAAVGFFFLCHFMGKGI